MKRKQPNLQKLLGRPLRSVPPAQELPNTEREQFEDAFGIETLAAETPRLGDSLLDHLLNYLRAKRRGQLDVAAEHLATVEEMISWKLDAIDQARSTLLAGTTLLPEDPA